jgi:hypothetical protein
MKRREEAVPGDLTPEQLRKREDTQQRYLLPPLSQCASFHCSSFDS